MRQKVIFSAVCLALMIWCNFCDGRKTISGTIKKSLSVEQRRFIKEHNCQVVKETSRVETLVKVRRGLLKCNNLRDNRSFSLAICASNKCRDPCRGRVIRGMRAVATRETHEMRDRFSNHTMKVRLPADCSCVEDKRQKCKNKQSKPKRRSS